MASMIYSFIMDQILQYGRTRWVAYGRIMRSYTFCSKINFDLIAYLYDSLFIHTTTWLVHAENLTNHKYYQKFG